jgi:hypothetical protein
LSTRILPNAVIGGISSAVRPNWRENRNE